MLSAPPGVIIRAHRSYLLVGPTYRPSVSMISHVACPFTSCLRYCTGYIHPHAALLLSLSFDNPRCTGASLSEGPWKVANCRVGISFHVVPSAPECNLSPNLRSGHCARVFRPMWIACTCTCLCASRAHRFFEAGVYFSPWLCATWYLPPDWRHALALPVAVPQDAREFTLRTGQCDFQAWYRWQHS